MPLSAIIGFGAGIATALLLISTTTGGLGLRLFVYLMAPLPLVLAGLGAGYRAAIAGAIVSAAILAAVLGPLVALMHLAAHGIPAAVLCYLALLNRELATDRAPITGAAPTREWYPVGRIVAAATILAGLHGYISTMVLGVDIEQQRQMLRQLMEVLAERLPRREGQVLSEADIASLVELGVYTLPAAAALSWLLSMLFNLYLGARITAMSGGLQRPLPDVPSMVFPTGFGLGLAVALPLAYFLAGTTLSFMGSAFAGAFFGAHLLMGLAIIHDISRGTSGRPAILAVLYVALVFLNSWVALALAIFAALAPVLPLKRGRAPATNDTD